MRLSTRSHAVLDFATAGLLLTVPRLFGASDRLTKLSTAFALAKLGYTLLTRHEGGVIGVLPMKAHLALDAVGGAAVAALPFLSAQPDQPAAAAGCVAAGRLDLAAYAATDPRRRTHPVSGHTLRAPTRLAC